ncbi:MAG: LytR/AlgR family response regulator transcription factor [Janthinobacterium lividum]
MAAAALTALIIDDEPLARQELHYLLECAGGVSVVAQGSNGVEAVDLIRTHHPDVVFLDVRMPGLDGFAVLRKLLAADQRFHMPAVVFATAFDQYAVKAFEVNAVDYLLKPFDSKRLNLTLEKIRSRVRFADDREGSGITPAVDALVVSRPPETHYPAMHASAEPAITEPVAMRPQALPLMSNRARLWDVAQAKLDALLRMVEEQAAGTTPSLSATPARTGRVVVRTGSRLLLVDQKDVCFAAIEDGRITVVTKTLEGDSNVRTLEELADQLDSGHFWRAHRSYLVNIQHIREVVPWFKSSYQLRMDDRKGTEIPVSRSQTKRLRELFNL